MNRKHFSWIGMVTVTAAAVVAMGLGGFLNAAAQSGQGGAATAGVVPQGEWATDSIWYDGLVEKAVYDAEKVIYGHPRQFESVILTNKEQHDTATWTKDAGEGGNDAPTVEVWKHNIVEVVPTPNYEYKFETTTHQVVEDLSLTRLDVASQEWCGATFKQFQRAGGADSRQFDYFGFSYMPEQGRKSETLQQGDKPLVPFNALSLYLRGYDFQSRQPLEIAMIPDQKSNKLEPIEPVDATVTFAGETEEGYKLDVKAGGETIGTFTFAKDRRHLMLAYEGANGDKYTLKSLDRIDYWTRDE